MGKFMLENIDYAKFAYRSRHHRQRYKSRVMARKPQLVCQECGGGGGWIEPVLDFGEGPWEQCGWCEGTGLMDGHRRADWLHCKYMEKHPELFNEVTGRPLEQI